MAREQRYDVDYFPHECTHGRKMHIIETKYGNDGYAAWFKLLEQLGKANNHYIDVSDEMNLMFLISIFKVERDIAISILDDLAKLNAIDKDLYENHKIIFSKKFIESIRDAYRKRKTKIFEYSDLINQIEGKKDQSTGRNPKASVQTGGSLPEVIPKEEKSRVKKNKEEKSKEDYEARKLKFSSTIEPYLKIYGRQMLNDFYKYWTEPNKSKTKFRQELEKTWDLERRLETWSRNDKNFNNNQNGEAGKTVVRRNV